MMTDKEKKAYELIKYNLYHKGYECSDEELEALGTILNIIEKQQKERQTLIDKLKKHNEEDKESVKRYEKMRRNTESQFYKKSYQTNIHKLNVKREVRNEIINMLEVNYEERTVN